MRLKKCEYRFCAFWDRNECVLDAVSLDSVGKCVHYKEKNFADNDMELFHAIVNWREDEEHPELKYKFRPATTLIFREE